MKQKGMKEFPTMTLKPSDFIYDKREDGWELAENVELGNSEISLQLNSLLREGEKYVKGSVVLERAKQMGNLAGQLHAERLLGLQKSIPKEWENFYLLFAGTVWRDPKGTLREPGLYWEGRKWYLEFDWFDGNIFSSNQRLVRLCK